MRRIEKAKRENGFTLVEILIAIAILIIISVIAIPAIGSLRKNLEMTRYDDMARQIYLVTQNRLTTMKATGTLDDFMEVVKKDYTDRKLTTEPQDFGAETDDWKKLYYFTGADAAFVNFIAGSDSVLLSSLESGGNFIVELNPETGDVYGVFYTEKTFTYDEVTKLTSRLKDTRKIGMLGYYGGTSGLSAASNLPTVFSPTVAIVNKEDLYIDLQSTGMRKLIKFQNNIEISVTLTDESYVSTDIANHSYTIRLKGGSDFFITGDTLKAEVLLDSIRGGDESFAEITEGKLTAGDNIAITVAMTYTNDGLTITGAASGATNSLFAEKNPVDGALSVSYVRHMNNLRSSIYEVADGKETVITQMSTINYDYTQWPKGSVIKAKEGITPYTGDFPSILNEKLFDKATFNGNNNKLLNFEISLGGEGTKYVGLFSKLKDCNMKDMQLVNFKVTGTQYVGALAGEVNGGNISSCRVYLETKDGDNRPFIDMEDRVKKYKVVGTQYVGGLIGQATKNTVIDQSFAALDVDGTQFVGGFIGRQDGGSISTSYASGKVTLTSNYGGGFAGELNNARVANCYASADVITNTSSGGFVGRAANGSITNCSSYGAVKTGKDKGDTVPNSGGFVGTVASTNITNSDYLRQANYNYNYDAVTGVLAKGFPDLKVLESNSAEDCHPYSVGLRDSAMPFRMLRTGTDMIIPHYGDWPSELKLQTSLVYYEKYKDADATGNHYGYYAETSLAAEGEDVDAAKLNSWRVNTLRDEPCVEDGYAIMTIYALDKFTYTLNEDLLPAGTKPKASDVYIAPNKPVNKEDKTAVKITDKVSLEFINKNDGAKYTISNAKVFQLPFELQMTDRNKAYRFYDRVKMTGYVGANTMFADYVFFYCPDFAKNAINPDISNQEIDTPKNPTGEEYPIAVRSPRQINAMSRAAYYWNTTQWTDTGANQLCFKQETDINFAMYTKKYCGIDYDLMNTAVGNPYRNRPIGRPNNQTFTDPSGATYVPSNFKNIYDGQGFEIIDYCSVMYETDEYQFTGLFGEVQNAVIKNVVMVASDPDAKSGYVESRYNDWKEGKHPGVGALVGLNYVAPNESGQVTTISNCAVSGYTVTYNPTGAPVTGFAVGGLVGHNFGKIENSSAVSKLVSAENDLAGNGNRYVGGLVGSMNGKGTVTNCYSGGVVSATAISKSTTFLGGIAGGFDNIYGAFMGENNVEKRIENSYSYNTWTEQSLLGATYPVAPNINGIKTDASSSYYLTNTVETDFVFTDVSGATAQNFKGLSMVTFGANGTAKPSGRASEQNTHPWSRSLDGIAYPFPAVVTDPSGGNVSVHYGDWYNGDAIDSGCLTYYEIYSDGTFAARYMDGSGNVKSIGVLDVDNTRYIAKSDYGVLKLSEDTGTLKIDNKVIKTTADAVKKWISIGSELYDLYSIDTKTLLTPVPYELGKKVTFQYDEIIGTGRETKTMEIYANGNFADTLSSKAVVATKEFPLKARTDGQLQNMNTAGEGWYIRLDHNVVASPALGNIYNMGFTFDGGYVAGGKENIYSGYKTGGKGNYIFGLQNPLFAIIFEKGIVQNLGLINVQIKNGTQLASVADISDGLINNCFATGSVSSKGIGAGLVAGNTGTITNSYANVKVTAGVGGAGFAYYNRNTISNSYSAGSVNGGTEAGAGFVGSLYENSTIEDCYSVTSVLSGKSIYGFSSKLDKATVKNCYWAQDKTINKGVTAKSSTGKPITLARMEELWNTGAWTKDNAGETWPDLVSGSYPYSRLKTLAHYGDWPVDPS